MLVPKTFLAEDIRFKFWNEAEKWKLTLYRFGVVSRKGSE